MHRVAGLCLAIALVTMLALPGWCGEELPPAAESNTVKTAFQVADTNADGKVTSDEMKAAMIQAAFAKTDKNGDHVISWEEWAAVDKAPGARERYDTIDIGKDAKITFFEFQDTASKSANANEIYSSLDKNGDGTLSQDEYSGHPHFRILSVQF